MEIEHGIIVVRKRDLQNIISKCKRNIDSIEELLDDIEILHFYVFDEEPDGLQYALIYHELKHNPPDDLVGLKEDLILIPATKSAIDQAKMQNDMFVAKRKRGY